MCGSVLSLPSRPSSTKFSTGNYSLICSSCVHTESLYPSSCKQVQLADGHVLQAVLTDLPGLLFFSTYTLLVLFWAEIYHQARSLPTSKLRPIFVTANAIVYLVQVLNSLFC